MQTNEVIEKVFKSKNTLYAIDEFKEYINDLENIFSFSNDNGKIYLESLGNFDSGQQKRLISSKSKNAPEEIIRQLWVYKLINHYGYSKEQIALERYITIGSTHFDKPVDIIVYSKTDQTTPKIIIEVKKPKRKDGLEQLKSYMEPQGSPLGMWSNGSDKVILYRPYPRDYDTVPDIPKASETIDDIFEKKNKLSDLDENYNFKKLIQNLEELAIADSGEDEFDEIFKILFAKMYDEIEAMESRNEQELFFRKEKNSEATYSTINNLFKEANAKWKGIFPKDENIRLKKGHLQVCVGPIQNLKIIGSNLKIFDDAFEYLIPTEAKKKKGQFFTPRNVIEMCVRILNPKKNEFIFDPSCGSAGFLIHALEWSFPNLKNINHKNEKKSNYASKYLWGIDFENKAIKTSKSMMLIAGDGSSNIFGPDVNSLNPKTWYETVSGKKFIQKLYESDLIDAEINDNENFDNINNAWKLFKKLKFDIILANPPFAGEIREKEVLNNYELAKPILIKNRNKSVKVERDILFLERIIDFLKPKGRAAIVLPQGQFNNSKLIYLRNWLFKKVKILGVIGLDVNTFSPHTSTKTSVLIIQKYSVEEENRIKELENKINNSVPDFKKIIEKILEEQKNSEEIDEDKLDENIISYLDETSEESEENTDEAILDLPNSKYDEDEEIKQTDEELLLEKSSEQNELNKNINDINLKIEKNNQNENKNEKKIINLDLKNQLKNFNKLEKKLNKDIKKLQFEINKKSLKGRLKNLLFDDNNIVDIKNRFIDRKISENLNYNIFMAVSKKSGKTSSGKYVFVEKNNKVLLDQDLYNEELTKHNLEKFNEIDKQKFRIAEKFIEFAKEENIDFWNE